MVVVDPAKLVATLSAVEREGRQSRPSLARRILFLALSHLCPATGRIELSREAIAAQLGATVEGVSYAMSALDRAGAILRERSPVPGRRGSGPVAYFLNPALARPLSSSAFVADGLLDHAAEVAP